MHEINIFLAGDSTMSYYDSNVAPRAGWGQMLQDYMNDKVCVYNEAASGRSSKSFITEKRLERIGRRLRNGDYLLIQFGHNDEKDDEVRHTEPYTTFPYYLSQYIELARRKQAHPVLLTPVQRRKFDAKGKLLDTHGDYPEAVNELAKEADVPVIDLCKMSKELLEDLGPENAKDLFLWLSPGQHTNYPEGIQDDTHFCEDGARQIAKLVISGMESARLPLMQYVNERCWQDT